MPGHGFIIIDLSIGRALCQLEIMWIFSRKRKDTSHCRNSQNELPLFCPHTSSSRQWTITVTITTTHWSLSIGCHGRLGSWISKMHYFILCILIQERIIVNLSAIRFHLMRNFSSHLLMHNIIIGLLRFLL